MGVHLSLPGARAILHAIAATYSAKYEALLAMPDLAAIDIRHVR